MRDSTAACCAETSPVGCICCSRCKKAKGPHAGPNIKQGSITADNQMDLLCTVFTIMNHSKDRKEHILMVMEVFLFSK